MTIKLYEAYYREDGDHYDVDAFATDSQLPTLDGDMWNAEYADRLTTILTFMDEYNTHAGKNDGKARKWMNALWNIAIDICIMAPLVWALAL